MTTKPALRRPRRFTSAHHIVPAMIAIAVLAAVLLVMFGPAVGSATAQITSPAPLLPETPETPLKTGFADQLEAMTRAMVRLPIATVLAALLALRPRRSGTPPRQLSVIQTQIILAIVGAIVMLVVGASLARAFGIVGAAGLIRYRAKIDDPKDAGVMLATLAIGLAAGVGQYLFAAFATVFVLGVLWIVESFEPEALNRFDLTINLKDGAANLRMEIEQILRRYRVDFELRATSADELSYAVSVPLKRNTETMTLALTRLAPGKGMDVKWDKKKKDK